MKWIYLIYFVAVSTIFCEISCRPYKDPKTDKNKYAVNVRDSVKGHNKQEKVRDLRETTLEEPTLPELVTTSSGSSDKDVSTTPMPIQCDKESQEMRKFKSCKSLHEAISAHFNRKTQTQRTDTTYNAFTLVDLFYSGLLEGSLNNRKLPSMVQRMDRGQGVCRTLLERLKPQNVSSGLCSWHYKCTYNPDRFPSFKVEAVIENQRHLDAEHCQKEKMKYVTVFEKTPCEEDPCGSAENWIERNEEILVGFKAA